MKENKTRLMLSITSLWVATILAVFVCGLLSEEPIKEIMKFGLLAVIFNVIFIYYLELFQSKIIIKRFPWWILGVGYFYSIVLLCNPYEIGKYPFWLIGILLIAIYVDRNLSLIMIYSVLFMAIGLELYHFDELVTTLVLGTLLCLMGKLLIRVQYLFYLIILIVSMNISLLFVMNGFSVNEVFTHQNYTMIASNVFILLILFLIIRVFKIKAEPEDAVQENEIQENEEVLEQGERLELQNLEDEKKNKEEKALQERDDLIAAVAEDAPLLMLLHQESDKLYQHSKLVGNISKRAAQYLGVDENLTCAGGWYHEIGRLKGKDYVPNGVELIKENHLPEKISELIQQHNYKVENPHSVEAVIIMLTDNIVSTITYLKNQQDTKISAEKVVENTFSVLMNKGTFNEAKIDIASFMKLKEFYLDLVHSKEFDM